MSQTTKPAAETLSAWEGLDVLRDRARQRFSRVSQDRWIVLLTGVLAWMSFAVGEQVAIRDGLGWEGEMYSRWVADFPHELRDVGIDAYCIQRVLPAAVLHYTFRAFHVSPSPKHILRGYAVVNTLSLMLVAAFWCATARRLKISDRGKWLGFVGLFLNFAVLKFSGYIPVMTDCLAYASGAAMMYFYLARNRWGLWGTTLLGALVWPTQLYMGTILSLFPRREEATGGQTFAQAEIRAAPWRLNWWLAGFAAWCWFLWSRQACERIQIPLFGGLMPIQRLLPLSWLISVLFVFGGLGFLLNDARLFRRPRISWKWAATATVTLLLAVALKATLQSLATRPGYMGLPVHLYTIGISAVAKPGLFLISHIVYFGPFWLLALFLWRPICRAMQQAGGMGLILCAAIGIGHALDAESRHLIYLLPLLVPFVVQVIDHWSWSRNQLVLLVISLLLFSKCWLVIGGPFLDNANALPDQLFWMNVGTFMADLSYVAQAIACAVCAVMFYLFLVRPHLRAAAAGDESATTRAVRWLRASATRLNPPTTTAGSETVLAPTIHYLRIGAEPVGANEVPAQGDAPPLADNRRLFPALTGVRMLAAYLVFLHHFPPQVKHVGSVLWGILSEGHIGVTMFFVLSGFLITHRYNGKVGAGGRGFKTYLWNRFVRIYPLYFLLLVPTLILAHEHNWWRWLTELTLFKGFFDDYKFAGIGQAWSLTAEECFYFSAPLLIAALHSRWKTWVVPACYLAGLTLLAIGSRMDFYQFFGNARFVCGYTFFGRAFEFALGAWLALNLHRLESLRGVWHKTYLGLAGILACAWVLDGLKREVIYPLGVMSPQGIVVNNWLLPFAIGLFYLGLIQERTWLGRLLSSPPCQLLGKSSYAFYLIHLGFISQFVAERAKGVWLFLILNVIAIGLFKLVEEPLQRYLRPRFFGRVRPARAETLLADDGAAERVPVSSAA